MIDALFSAGGASAMVGWGLLIFVPRWRGLAQAVAGYAVPALLSTAYAALIAAWWSRGEGGFGSIDAVRSLFQTPALLLAGWLHYLAFDLFVGAWIARESRRDGVPHLAVAPILVLTFLFGPIGYLASLIVRGARRVGRPSAEGEAASRIARAFDRVAGRDRTLMAASFVCFALMVPTAFAWAIDDRTLGGVGAWIKPLKFLISLGIYLGTLGFFMPMAGASFRRSVAGRFVAWGAIVTSGLEIAYIAWRASRGEASHFNHSTPAASFLYALMGVGALILAAAGPVLAWGVSRRDAPPADPTYRLGVVLGLLLTFGLGVVSGAVMASGTNHFVGTPPAGGSILPFVGWSRTVGDLRVPHFLGLHAQQVIAVVGALAAARLGRRGRMIVVIGFAALYAIIALGLFAQAVAGRPFLPA